MHLKPTAECQISILIFKKKKKGGLNKYPIKYIKNGEVLAHFGFKLKVLPGDI
jgi:hypothetical protein